MTRAKQRLHNAKYMALSLGLGLGAGAGRGGGGGKNAFYGMNIGGARRYNNMFATTTSHWRGDPQGNGTIGQYNSMPYPYVDALGNLATMPPGVSIALGQIDFSPTPSSTTYLRLTWTGDAANTVTFFDVNGLATATVKTGNQIDVTIVNPASPPLPAFFVQVDAATFNAANPVKNFDCREITAMGGSVVDAGLFYAPFITERSRYGRIRTMDIQGTNNQIFAGTVDGKSVWASRAQSSRALEYRGAELYVFNGTDSLFVQTQSYLTSSTALVAFLPNSHWFGTQGNSVTLTIAAATATASVVVTGRDIVVTPVTGSVTLAAIKAQIDANASAALMVSTSLNGTGTTVFGTLAKTNLSKGYDGAIGGYLPDMVALANACNAQLDMCLPINAAADYVTNATTYLNANLTKLPFGCQKGNEPWNFAFPVAKWLSAWAQKNGYSGATDADWVVQEYAHRCIADFTLAKAAAGANVKTEANCQNTGATFATGYVAVTGFNGNVVDALVTAPYFYPTQDQPSDPTYFNGGYTSVNTVLQYFNDHVAIAATATPPISNVYTYEGGQHDTGSTLVDNQRHQRDPRMKTLYGYYLSEMKRRCGLGSTRPFIHYYDVSAIYTGAATAWGLQEFEGQSRAAAPKYDAYLNAIAGIFPPYYIYPNAPSITGSRVVGSVLTLVQPTAYNVTTTLIQWQRNAVNIGGATGSTYTQVAGDLGTTITAVVTLTNSNSDVATYSAPNPTATTAFKKYVFIKTTGTFTVPADVPASCLIHCIGAGGRGYAQGTGGSPTLSGGGGGAYANSSLALTPGAVVNVQVGGEGLQVDTWFSSAATVLAKSALNATSSAIGTGGTAAASIGTVKFDGGSGTIGGAYISAGGGGGAAGPSGIGRNAGASGGGSGGGGGGGSNGGSSTVGLAGVNPAGGAGGQGNDGTGGGLGENAGVAAIVGTNGGGGGGAVRTVGIGAAGGMQSLWTQTSNSELAGPAGGGGGASDTAPGAGGGSTGYGGGSGGGWSAAPTPAAPGLIVLEYAP